MTLQPMTTAPRDGSEVWLMLKSGGQLVKCRWTEHEEYPLESWVSVDEQLDGEYDDNEFSGWLDIEAMALDSERLDYLENEVEIGRRLLRHTDQIIDPLFLRGEPITRAAIDKEIGRA